MNVEDAKDKLVVTAEVPGFDKENLKVNISDDNVLTICGEQKKEHIEESKDKKYVRSKTRARARAAAAAAAAAVRQRICSG